MTIHWDASFSLRDYTKELKWIYETSNQGIAARIAAEGRYAKLPANSAGIQKFLNKSPFGPALEIGNLVPHSLQWSDLEDVIKGLEHGPDNLAFMCGSLLCHFEFSLEHGDRIGYGRTYKDR